MVNRSVTWAEWDDELLVLELRELAAADFDLSLTGFDPRELEDLLMLPNHDEQADVAPPQPENPVSRPGDLWLCGNRRNQRPFLMITDPPYGIELDSEWRDRAGLNTAPGQKRTKAMRQTAKTNPQIPS
jgi:hypothetical protein